MIALPAHWLVHVLTAYHLSDVLGGCADVETRREIASLADSLQLLHLFALRHQLNDGLKHGAHTSGIQGGYNHHLALVCCVFAPGCYLEREEYKKISPYILEKLAFVDADDIIELPLFPYVREASRPNSLGFMSTFELDEIDDFIQEFCCDYYCLPVMSGY